MYKLRNYLLCAFTAILLFFAAFAAEGAFVMKKYALVPETYKYILKLNGSYEKAYNELCKQFESEENATGIPASVYTDAVTEEVLHSMIDSQIDSAFDCIYGNAPTVENTSSEEQLKVLKTSIEKFFDEYAKSINYQKDEAYFQKLDSVYASASEKVTDTADVYQLNKIAKAGFINTASKLVRYSDKICYAAFGITGFLLLVLIIANIKGISGFFYWMSISFGSVSALMVAGSIGLKHSHYFNRFAIKAQHIYSSITGACYYYTDLLLMINAAVLAVSVISMIIFWVAGRKKVSVQ